MLQRCLLKSRLGAAQKLLHADAKKEEAVGEKGGALEKAAGRFKWKSSENRDGKKFVLKGGVAGTGALKILALPKRGGSDPCQDFLVDL